jgi:hypothetical protein
MDTVTDSKGRYTVPIPEWAQDRSGLHVRVGMEHPDYLSYWDNGPIETILAKKDDKKVAEFRQAKLTLAREIVGRVLKPDGEPAADATLYKQYNKEQYAFGPEARNVRDNDFPRRMRGPLLQVAARGYVAIRRAGPDLIEQPYAMSAERDQGDIRLSHGTRFIGRALTSTDEPVKNAYVSVRFADDNFGSNSDRDADGRFKTESVRRANAPCG